MNKWEQWYNSLPEHTKIYLQHKAIWTDADLAKFSVFAFIFGLLFGLII